MLVPQLAQLSALTAARLRECGCLLFGSVDDEAEGMVMLGGEAFAPSCGGPALALGPAAALSGDPGASVSAISSRVESALL